MRPLPPSASMREILPGGIDGANAVALTPDRKIVVAGGVWNGSRQVPGIMRLTSTGQPDNTFDGDGQVYLNLDEPSQADAVVVQPRWQNYHRRHLQK